MSFISKLLFYVAASSIFLRPFVSNLAFPHEDYFLWLLLAFSATPFVIINKKRIKTNRFDLFFLLFGAYIVLSLQTSSTVSGIFISIAVVLLFSSLFEAAMNTKKESFSKQCFFPALLSAFMGSFNIYLVFAMS